MSDSPSDSAPTLKSSQGFKLQIPHTPEGIALLGKLKELAGGKDLPFVQSSPTLKGGTDVARPSGTGSVGTGSTTYALDLRLEQEGWPP